MTTLQPAPIRLARHRWGLLAVALTVGCTAGLATVGVPARPIDGVVAAAYALIAGGLLAAAYLGAAVGFGLVLTPLLAPRATARWAYATALGLAFLLAVSHALGVLGLFAGAGGVYVAGGTLLVGLAVLTVRVAVALAARPPAPSLPAAALVAAPALAVLLVAAANPPGALWQSEAAGYDALSYHLPLAQEWAQLGRLRPVEHNVYSYLPSYVEAAFMHLAVLLGAGDGGSAGARVPIGLVGGEGIGALACQLLHAGCAVLAALLTGAVVRAALRGWRGGPGVSMHGAAVGGAALLATPWVVVVSSLAYNEAAVLALYAGALLAAIDGELKPASRGGIAGLLVGAAFACKPTAAFLVAPTVGLALLAHLPARAWLPALLAGAAGGLALSVPPLLRNAFYGGNPIFPAGGAIFGAAHWTAEQVARFAAAHQAVGSVADRAALLVSPLPDPTSLDNQPRGVLHRQWSILFPLGAVGLLLALGVPAARRLVATFAVGMLLAFAWWIAASHAQSRFLLPLAVPLCAALGIGSAWALTGQGPPGDLRATAPRRLAAILLTLAALGLSVHTLVIFLGQHRDPSTGAAYPNLLLVSGVAGLTGQRDRAALATLPEADQRELLDSLSPAGFINHTVPPEEALYLLGDATPLYFAGRLHYHTTWDRSPLARAIEAAPDDPGAWTRALRGLPGGAGGTGGPVRWVLLSTGELERLSRSGWWDPVLTATRIQRWLEEEADEVRRWPQTGQILYRLRTPDADRPPWPRGAPAGPEQSA